ncbi:MAG TPA: OsmC family peroxiredoxin [Polyangiaceae bacterium]
MGISKAQAEWTGSLKEGKGSVKGSSGKFEAPFSFATRFEGAGGGTNPEELIGAAHAGCFSMFLAAQLSKDGHVPTRITTSANVHLDAGPVISKIELETVAVVPGIDEKLFNEKVEFSKQNCPVSKALGAVPTLSVNARLER